MGTTKISNDESYFSTLRHVWTSIICGIGAMIMNPPFAKHYLASVLPQIFLPVAQIGWRLFYNAASRVATSDEKWQFINYGYYPDDGKFIQLDDEYADKCGNSCIQLYHEVASAVPIEGKNIVEIGCGRGGGAAYIARNLKPATMTALDLSTESVQFARKTNKDKCPNLNFQQGDALSLPLPDGVYDVVINVESSHCYSNFAKFVSEVYRVLKPGGYFVMCDIRNVEILPQMELDMSNAGFDIQVNIEITPNVLKSMEYNTPKREALMKEMIGLKWFNGPMKAFYTNFGGLVGSNMYNSLQSGFRKYKRYVLQKPKVQVE